MDDFEQLRRLLLSAELNRLAEVEHRLADPDVRARELNDAIRRNRRQFAEALAPAMGPAIRRAIAEALRGMADSFNQLLQHSLSWRALRWRLEAWRTGRPFAEVLLSHSLVFRVEQVFLVHRASGLLLQHAAADAATVQDGDLVSGMLTAIQDFVRDSFSVDAEQAVDTMRVGDLVVWVEQGADAYLAAVIRGIPPASLRPVLRDALDAIHLELGEELSGFSGDATVFEHARHRLESCLQVQVQAATARRRWVGAAAAGGVAALLLATWGLFEIRASRRWNAYLSRLHGEPGVIVLSEDHGLRRASIAGLVDPDAADPVRLLPSFGLDAARVSSRWQRFLSLEPPMVLARARSALKPPASVHLSAKDGLLTAAGRAPHGWVVAARRRADTIPGVSRFDTAGLTDQGLAELAAIGDRLAPIVLRFDAGSSRLTDRERGRLDSAVAALREVSAVAAAEGLGVAVEVVGRTDGTGSERANVPLSRARAEAVVSAIQARGIRNLSFSIVGAGANFPLRAERSDEDRALNRSVTFRVVPAEER